MNILRILIVKIQTIIHHQMNPMILVKTKMTLKPMKNGGYKKRKTKKGWLKSNE